MSPLISKAHYKEAFILKECALVIDVEGLVDALNRRCFPFETVEMEMEELELFAKLDFREDRILTEMTDVRRDEPVIVASYGRELRVVDGNHRIKKRMLDGFGCCEVIIVPPAVLCQFAEPLAF